MPKELSKQLSMLMAGMFLIGLGVYPHVQADIGAEPFTVLAQGIPHLTGLQFGRAMQSLNVIIILVILIADRRRIGLATLLSAVLVAFFADTLMGWIPHASGTPAAALMLLAAVVGMGVGVWVFISADLGEGAVEGLVMLIHRRTGLEVRWARVLMDSACVLVGALLGGCVGVRTLIGAFCTGRVIQETLRVLGYSS
ncbi:MAG: YczE/YyaS/YitT family protein [Bacteroidota bacterium]